MSEPLRAEKILSKVYHAIIDATSPRAFELTRARALVADYSDGHKMSEEHVWYRQAQVFSLQDHTWALLPGTGGHQEDDSCSELLAIPLEADTDDDTLVTIITDNARSNYWSNRSLLWIEDVDGSLRVGCREGEYSLRRPELAAKIQELASKHTVTRARRQAVSRYFDGVSGRYSYDREIVPSLTKLFLGYFADPARYERPKTRAAKR
jgi:hypothetical protein